MNKRSCITSGVILLLLLISPIVAAKTSYDRIIWGKSPDPQHGLYTVRNYFVAYGISASAFSLYYFGDVDNEGIAFNGGFNLNNLSLGGGFCFGYNIPAGNRCNLRFTFLGGTLQGNNELKFSTLKDPRDDFRSFRSLIFQPGVGVQYYPFSKAGLFLYGGVSMTASIINHYEFYYYKSVPSGKERRRIEGKTFGILPMIQLSIGYSWRLAPKWSLSAEVMIQEGLIDTHYMNLDAWPMDPSQNNDRVALGGTGLTYTNRYGEKTIHWNDGWFQIGVTVTYHWRNCERCNIINNYQNIKPRSR